MDRKGVIKKLNELFCEVFEDDSIVLNECITNKDIQKWDSLANMTLVMLIEESFSIKLTINDMMKMHSVGEIVNIIIEKIS